jgi:hypothetical protein
MGAKLTKSRFGQAMSDRKIPRTRSKTAPRRLDIFQPEVDHIARTVRCPGGQTMREEESIPIHMDADHNLENAPR